jgi:DNA polymerase-3 subunit delta'
LLDYAGGAPLLALQIAEETEVNSSLIKQLALGAKLDPFACAPLLMGLGMVRALETLQKWVFDLASFALSQQPHYHPQQRSTLQALCNGVNLSLLLQFQQKLLEAKKTATHPLSNELQLENMLLQYRYIFKKR